MYNVVIRRAVRRVWVVTKRTNQALKEGTIDDHNQRYRNDCTGYMVDSRGIARGIQHHICTGGSCDGNTGAYRRRSYIALTEDINQAIGAI